jgi:hypothetical protein
MNNREKGADADQNRFSGVSSVSNTIMGSRYNGRECTIVKLWARFLVFPIAMLSTVVESWT